MSPDGEHVAFIVTPMLSDPRNSHLHVARLDGSPSVQVSGIEGTPQTVSWSPDSRRLVVWTKFPTQLLTLGSDGAGLATIVDSLYGGNPHWSPGGDRIVFAGWDGRSDGTHGVWTIGSDGLDAMQVTDDPVFIRGTSGALIPAPRFSPDGQWIVVESAADLHVVRADGSDRRQLTFTPQEDEWHVRWSPDGRRIAFVADGGAYWMTQIMDVATGEVTGGVVANGASSAVYASWSPDGERIAVMLSPIVYTHQEPGGRRDRVVVARSDAMANWTAEPLPTLVGQGVFPQWWSGR